MDILIGILIGICFWSLVGIILYFLYNDFELDEQIFLIMGGPFVLIGALANWVYNYIKYFGLQSLIVYKDKIYRVKPKVQKELRKYNVIRLASYEKYHEKENWDINDFPKRVVYGRRPRMRYTPKKIWSRYPVFNVSIVELEREEQNFKEGKV